jgi:TolB-like protein
VRFAFGECTIDIERRELRRGTELVDLEPQVFDLLAHLLRHRERVVDKDDLLRVIWRGRIVSDSAVTTRINAVRRAIGDDGKAQRLIRTFPRKGVRFVAKVGEVPADPPTAPAGTEAHQTALALPDKPSIAVLSFANIGDDPDQEYFADGMVEEIITALSRIRSLFVIARSSSFIYKNRAVDVKRVGLELGVRYLVEGSVRRALGRIRITAQLIEAATGAHLWADRFDGTLEDVFELQERIAVSIAGAIEPEMEANEIRHAAQRPTSDLTAYDLYLRALPDCYSYSAKPLQRARDVLGEAIARDPVFAPALALAAGCRHFLGCAGWVEDPEMNRQKAVELARQALQIDNGNPVVLAEAARVLAYFDDQEIDAAITLIERSLELNPSYARGWYWGGWVRLYAGQPVLAVEHFQTSLRLDPHLRTRPYMTGNGVAHFFNRQYEEAVEALIASINEFPGWPTTYRFLAASYVQLGKIEKARAVIQRLRAITPALASPADRSAMPPFRDREQMGRYLEGLRLAADVAPRDRVAAD